MFHTSFRPLLALALAVLCLTLLLHTSQSAATPAGTGPDQTATIHVNTGGQPTPIDGRVLGSNLPAWLNPTRLADNEFRTRTAALGASLMRIPGGSWSNYYDWLACERFGVGIDPNAVCYWPWAARPTDFLNFLRATGIEGMYTINQNGTAKEAAALVAFFNGSVNDDRVIGVDVRGRDWGRVSDWARLRRDNGNLQPLPIRYWEIGNEIYGGTPDSGTDCVPWGWEQVWTCDGSEYVYGIGSGTNRKEGYLEFRSAMRAVDPTILVGAVGVPFQAEWTNWGNEVIAAAGDVMDFYVIHQYAYFAPPGSYAEALAQPHGIWADMMADVEQAFDQYAGGRRVPVAITEHNLFSVQEQDSGDWMSRAVNALFMADTLGQMLQQGFAMGNQWDLAHGEGGDPPGYGLMQAGSYFRSPQYYVFPLWARFGAQMLPVTNSAPAGTTLSVYAGRLNPGVLTLLAINKTGSNQPATIYLDGAPAVSGGSAYVVQAASLDATAVTYNGLSNPAGDLSNAPPFAITNPGNPLAYTFPPYSVTLLQLVVPISCAYCIHLPLLVR